MVRGMVFLLMAGLCGAAVTYSYDASGRLIKVDYGNGSSISYTYDKNGNLTSRTTQSAAAAGPAITSVTTAYAGPDISQNTWIAIKGTGLVPSTIPASGVIWNDAPDFAQGKLPTSLGGVSVTVNNKPAFVYFFCSAATSASCAQDQINVLTPLDSTTGPVPVVVTSGGTSSAPFSANLKANSPSFLLFSTAGYVVATHANGSLLGPVTLYPGASTPAKPGEPVVVYGVGWGMPGASITNGSSSQFGELPTKPACQIGGTAVTPDFAGLISPGLHQFNLKIPSNASSGDLPIVCTYNGASSPSGDLITVVQ